MKLIFEYRTYEVIIDIDGNKHQRTIKGTSLSTAAFKAMKEFPKAKHIKAYVINVNRKRVYAYTKSKHEAILTDIIPLNIFQANL